MDKIKVLVVEDEIIVADNICDTLEELGYEVTEPAINYTEALILIEGEKPDIAVLDIQLSGRKTGIDIAKKILESYNFPFIFLTSNADQMTINEAKETMPNAYLVKPFSKDDLYSAIEIALSNFLKKETTTKKIEDDNLFIKNKGSYIKIKQEDIFYVKSNHVYLEIVLKNLETFLLRRSLVEILDKLNSNFVRIHRGYILNYTLITSIDSASLKAMELHFPIGKKYKKDVLKRINVV